MKTKKEDIIKTVRNKYTPQFKGQALEQAGRDGFLKVAQDLGLAEAMLYSWRTSPLKDKSPSRPNWPA